MSKKSTTIKYINNSNSVSLPLSFILKHDLTSGDAVDVIEYSDRLVIRKHTETVPELRINSTVYSENNEPMIVTLVRVSLNDCIYIVRHLDGSLEEFSHADIGKRLFLQEQA